ncbi:MAG: hypothetical protein Q4C35_08620 [Eubacteriales bacterium]|nr:hypothetical protein [Eubacteriales bacterium]
MKKQVSILMLCLCLCLCLAPGAFASSIQIPATSQEALNQLPMSLPPLPEITVDSTSYSQGTAFVISGLDAWPIEYIKNYQNGVFLYSPKNMSTDGLKPIKGLEKEPFAIIMSEDASTVNFVLKKSKLEYFQMTLNEEEVEFTLRFANKASCVIRSSGTLRNYSFTSKEVEVSADYDEDGLLQSYSYFKTKWTNRRGYIQLEADYNPLGDISRLYLIDEPDTRYSCYDGQWFYKAVHAGTEAILSCEEPKGFSFDTYPLATFYPAEDGAKIAEKYKSSLTAWDPLYSIDEDLKKGANPNNLFPPLPKILEETNDAGDLILTITGLSAWGVKPVNGDFYSEIDAQLLPVDNPNDEFKSRIAGDSLLNSYIWLCLPSDDLDTFNSINFHKFSVEDDWGLNISLENGSYYSFSLGDTPYLSYYECFRNGKVYSYDFLPDGSLCYSDIIQNIFFDGELLQIAYDQEDAVQSFVQFMEISPEHRVESCYNSQGELLSSIYYAGDRMLYYDGSSKEWTDFFSEQAVSAPEDFAIIESLDIQRLNEQLQ